MHDSGRRTGSRLRIVTYGNISDEERTLVSDRRDAIEEIQDKQYDRRSHRQRVEQRHIHFDL
jgi:hypothetical protein